ncbi:IS982 family transposase [Salinibacter ruber]|uniref:Transposase DDE domain-containing protein n=1 Tax=Salinibacter ruber TaxID=146919 RepID=A0A9X2Q8I9_9BACT|nr:IS982 family transposase [Salinibacter ruber]MCS3662408.1 hypothetical protein [Salinibacter ruber]MCS3712200.1 hypothetical protein [Salinibacter ruber]
MDDSEIGDTDADDSDWKNTLIRVYLFVCRRWSSGLCTVAQRQSNNSHPDFTDEEVLTIYLFGLIRKRETIKEIHEYAEDHFPEWFPDLPSYGGYVQRLNRLSAAFAPLTEAAIAEVNSEEVIETLRIADSFPVMMAKEKRSSQAKVAPQIADKGYCSSKDTFYHGVKLHVVAEKRPGTMPLPDRVGLTAGSKNDLQALRQALPVFQDGELYGDKAYVDSSLRERLSEEQNLKLLTPPKKSKGQKRLSAADKLLSEAVSRVRQPIESLFNWIDEKTGIQEASKVRSVEGLMVHAFGRLAAAMLLLALNP